jgi:putative transposase
VGDERVLINVSTRKFCRAVRLPEGDVPAPAGRRVEVGGIATQPASIQGISALDIKNGKFGAAVGACFAALMVRLAGVFRATFAGRPSARGTCAEGQRARPRRGTD